MPPTALSALSRTSRLLLIGFCILALLLLVPPVRASGQPDSTGHELVVNGGFEAGSDPWQFTAGAGRATNNPHTGQGLAYLDAGTGYKVSQPLTVDADGNYTASAWIGVNGAGGVFGLRDTDTGDVLASQSLPVIPSYRAYSLEPVDLSTGQHVEVFVTSSTENWINIDDVSVYDDLRELLSFKVDGQQGPSVIDHDARTVSFQLPYESDRNAVTAAVELPVGSTITPDPAQPLDYTQPRQFTITDSKGNHSTWTVTAVEEHKSIVISSSNDELVDTFNWAKWRARQHVQTGKRGPVDVEGPVPPDARQADYIPSYWAGYANRTAFYIRDYAHQAAGAHLLGLDQENKSMLQAYAATSNETRNWYPLWALNFDGSPYFLDHPSDDYFVREVPAVFELVDKAAEQYRWTGDRTYLDDPALWNFYTNAVTKFVKLHDTQLPNGVAEGTGQGIWYGAASYNERSDADMIEAGDGIATQYQAFRGYADLARARGDAAIAKQFDTRAAELFKYFNKDWGVALGSDEYVRGRTPDGAKVAGWGQENSMFMAYDEIIDPNSRKTNDFLDYMFKKYTENRPSNIESSTYVPDVMFAYGRSEQAWSRMKDIISVLGQPHEVPSQGTNGDYPEVSYTLVSQTVEGLAGIVPNAPANAVSTLSRLPKEIGWLNLDHITVGQHDLGVRHEGATRTTVTHNSGPKPLKTTVSFYGGYAQIAVNGRRVQAEHTLQRGKSVSSVTVSLPVGAHVTAEAVGPNDQKRWGDAITTSPDDFALTSPKDGGDRVSPRTAVLRWSPSANATEYRVTVAKDSQLSDVVRSWTVKGTTASAPSLMPGREYYWSVTAVNARTHQELPVPGLPHSFRTMPAAAPAAPTNLGAYRSGNRVALSWKSAPDALTAGIERAPVGSEDFKTVAESVTGDGWVDRDAAGGPWRYRVTSANERGAGAPAQADEQSLPTDLTATALSDREWESATIGWGSLGHDRSVSGGPIALAGVQYAKGIGTHANSEIVYKLDPADVRFSAMVGVDDFQRNSPYSSVVFQVEADGKVIYESPVMRGDSDPQKVDLDVLGVQQLTLRVTDAGDGNNSDHADWADATLRRLP
ncbi:NPCBM/NEW2 domain-containing protein [Kribbella kalugense]|uniref:Fibronectin type III domain protein n=1 Tax=Kribbella kalugense TaxID=2512221 RepID=A0A4R7ZVC0_9ACTN|nr:NPCBM/NEW2 domain-containing protein [Kribbella kalugense]TDW22039.1 fibronectin type III domain protein [Kribbella kalugense]